MVITGILMASVTIFGCKAIVWLNRLAIPGLVVLLAWLTYRIVTVYSDKLDFWRRGVLPRACSPTTALLSGY